MQLSKEKSVKTTINIKKENIISAGRVIDMDKLVNKDFYNIIKNKVFIKPIGIHFWTTYLDIQDFQNITDLYEFIFKILSENKLKIFRWKLLQFIIPTKSHLFKWKISTDSLCNVCKVEEDYDHFFMSCKYLDIFWNKINEMLKTVQFENNIRLQHLVFGYKIFDKEYFYLKYFFNYIGIYNLQILLCIRTKDKDN